MIIYGMELLINKMKNAKKIVQFGAGNIGRSLVGQLFSRAGYEVVFVDAVDAIVHALNKKGAYNVVIKDELPPGVPDVIKVENVRGIHAHETEKIAKEIATAELVSTAVGAQIAPKLCDTIVRGAAQRNNIPLSIILCENRRGLADIMQTKIKQIALKYSISIPPIGCVETSIGKMVPIMPAEVREENPLVVWAEAYNTLIADKQAFVTTLPDIEGVELHDNFDAYVDRKLFIHNFGHAVAAYHGALKGHTYIYECIADKYIRNYTRNAMEIAADSLQKTYPLVLNKCDLISHVDDLLHRFCNRALGDTVYRVGRDLKRKLAPQDRIIGTLKMVRAQNGDITPMCHTCAAALLFSATDEEGNQCDDDIEIVRTAARDGVEKTLLNVCNMCAEADQKIVSEITRIYNELRQTQK